MKDSKIVVLVGMIIWLVIGVLGNDHLAIVNSTIYVAAYWIIDAMQDLRDKRVTIDELRGVQD